MKIGDSAPKFCLMDQGETKTCLKDFGGKWVVLYFYPKDNTTGCTMEALDFTAALKDFEKLDSVILGVSPDSCSSHQKFIVKQDLKITLLSDPEREVLEKYGVWKLKTMYGRAKLGVVRSTYLIDPKGKVQYIWENVKVKGHVDAVKDKLKELQS